VDEYRIERLNRVKHVRGNFSCGKPALDDFLKSLVGQYEKRRLGKTFVLLGPTENLVLGYYTLASGSIPFEHLPPKVAKKLPKHPVPVVLLARLAIDQSVRGKGMGRALLTDALERIVELSKSLGIFAVEVDATDKEAQAFYLKYGFLPLLDKELHLFLPLATFEKHYSKG
jgi:GNAT superfamily N-acetyltransferase